MAQSKFQVGRAAIFFTLTRCARARAMSLGAVSRGPRGVLARLLVTFFRAQSRCVSLICASGASHPCHSATLRPGGVSRRAELSRLRFRAPMSPGFLPATWPKRCGMSCLREARVKRRTPTHLNATTVRGRRPRYRRARARQEEKPETPFPCLSQGEGSSDCKGAHCAGPDAALIRSGFLP